MEQTAETTQHPPPPAWPAMAMDEDDATGAEELDDDAPPLERPWRSRLLRRRAACLPISVFLPRTPMMASSLVEALL